jgi:hypothetical protein
MFELCYSISPLDGDWGLFSRSLLLTSRFLLRNDSARVSFQVKQTGASDDTVVEIGPGEAASFHWGDFRLPELISVRPAVKIDGRCIYKWSGGFDPLTIGSVPLRIRRVRGLAASLSDANEIDQFQINSVKMEAEIRPRTGKTGINLSFQEEDSKGEGSLFRIENLTTFPVWVAQDGVLANPWGESKDEAEREGDLVRPSESIPFGLDVPYRQGKYSHRKAATMAELLRIRLGLAPLSFRAGIETTKVLSLTNVGERVRLNPTKLLVLNPELRASLEDVRIVGIIKSDGPTRVLSLRYVYKEIFYCYVNYAYLIRCTSFVPRFMEKNLMESVFTNPFDETPTSSGPSGGLPPFVRDIADGAFRAAEMRKQKPFPSEEVAVKANVAEDKKIE